MLTFREYKPEDAGTIVKWVGSEMIMYQWSAHWIGEYPVRAEKLNEALNEMKKENRLLPLSFCDETGKLVGFLFMRYLKEGENNIRLGFVIVDPSIRGKGYGKQILKLAVDHARKDLNASSVSLGVFENNPKARYAYEAVGFEYTGEREKFETALGSWYALGMRYRAENDEEAER